MFFVTITFCPFFKRKGIYSFNGLLTTNKSNKASAETGNIDEIMMLIREEDSFLGLSIVGNLTYDQISMLTNKVKIDDFKNITD